MIENMLAWQRKAVAIFLLVLIAATVGFGGVMPLIDYYGENNRQIVVLEERLLRFSNKISTRDQIIKQSEDKQHRVNELDIFSKQRSMSLILADIQQQIKTVIATENGELSSTQNLSQKNVGELLRAGINVKFVGNMQTFIRVLHYVESAKPYMMVNSIKVVAAGNERNKNTGKFEVLDRVYVSADIVSFFPKPES